MFSAIVVLLAEVRAFAGKMTDERGDKMFSYILFDLDGTISDPKEGITKSVQYALSSFGIEEPDRDKLEPFIGPPLRDSFMNFYGFTNEQAEEAVARYRERFSVQGKFENKLYPGMSELLRDLQAAGIHLAIASSKPTVFVEEILQFFGIRQYFEIVVGSELDGTRDKKEEVVAEVLDRFSKEGAADPSCVVMIGDRKFDIEGAKAAGTHHIGVNYGYAAPGELEAAGAEIVVRDVEGLRRVLLGAGVVKKAEPADDTAKQAEPMADTVKRTEPAFGAADTAAMPGDEGPGIGIRAAYAEAGNGMYERRERMQESQLQPPPFIGYQRQQVPNGYAAQTNGGQSYYERYRQPQPGYGRRPGKPETKGRRIAKAIGISLLAMLTYYVVSVVVAGMVMIATMNILPLYRVFSYNDCLNLGNAAGTIAGFAACFGIWHRGIRILPGKRISGLSAVPFVILAASVAMGMNGFLSLVELYKYSPTFQEISEIQFDIPIWLGVLSYGILAPLGEEVVFRGVVYGQLKKVSNVPVAVVVSGIAFGLFHGNLVQAVYATVIGILLALVYELYDSILASMVFHGIANLFVYLLLDLTEIGGVFVMPLSCMFFLLMSVVSLVLMVKWQKEA